MDYKTVSYQNKFQTLTQEAIDQGYKDIGYSGIELDGIDSDLNDIETYYQEPSFFNLVFNGDELIASYAVSITKTSAELKRVYVKSSYRNQGLAKKISHEAFTRTKELGLSEIIIWSGSLCKAAHHMYQKLGAIATGEIKRLGGRDDVHEHQFIKKLT